MNRVRRIALVSVVVALFAAVPVGYWSLVGSSDSNASAYPRAATFGSDVARAFDDTTSSTTTSTTASTLPPTTEAPPPPTPTPTPAGPAAGGEGPSAAAAHGWSLVAADEFDGSAVDPGRWEIYNSAGNGGVGLRRPSAVSQGDGELRITGRGDVSGGMSWRGGRTYGRWEFRARSDVGNGYAPCILLWPSSNNWPAEGEIDVMEIPKGERRESSFTVHWGAENSQEGFPTVGDFSQWHTFAVEWLPDHITYYLDGQALHTITNPPAVPRWPMQLAIQNDVGPYGWIPARDANTPAEVTLHVDWVRLYSA